MSDAVIRIATRASRLALWQARHVAGLLESAEPGVVVELVEVSTEGDRDRVQRLDAMGGTGVLPREVPGAVLARPRAGGAGPGSRISDTRYTSKRKPNLSERSEVRFSG